MSFIDELKRLHEAAKDDGMHETEMERALLNEFLQNKAEAIIALVEAAEELVKEVKLVAYSPDFEHMGPNVLAVEAALAALEDK